MPVFLPLAAYPLQSLIKEKKKEFFLMQLSNQNELKENLNSYKPNSSQPFENVCVVVV
jgi:hypothetical protein